MGSYAKVVKEGDNIHLPADVAARARRNQARFVLSEEAPGHINPAAPKGGRGRLYQVLAKISFLPEIH